MIGSVNKAFVSGMVAKAPFLIESKDGTSKGWIGLQLAVTEKMSPTTEPVTTLFDVVIFEKHIAEYVRNNVQERDQILVEGRISKKEGKNKSGHAFTSISIVVTLGHNVSLLQKAYQAPPPGQMYAQQPQQLPPGYGVHPQVAQRPYGSPPVQPQPGWPQQPAPQPSYPYAIAQDDLPF